jgi:hypothetical protein
MALKNQRGEYTRITNIDLAQMQVYTETYRTEEARNAPSKFDQVIVDSVQCAGLDAELKKAPGKGSIKDDVWTAGYTALKQEPVYNNAGADQWVDC